MKIIVLDYGLGSNNFIKKLKDLILDELSKYNFNGVILDSNEILVKYFNSNIHKSPKLI
jgi:hypothetical protein